MMAYGDDPNHDENLIETIGDAYRTIKDSSRTVGHRKLALHGFSGMAVTTFEELPEVHCHLSVLGIVWQGRGHRRLLMTDRTKTLSLISTWLDGFDKHIH